MSRGRVVFETTTDKSRDTGSLPACICSNSYFTNKKLMLKFNFALSAMYKLIDESKHYVINQYHPVHYGLYPIASKYSGWQ